MLTTLANEMAHFPTEGKCAIGVSGGGDSLALCLMLKALGYDVTALHFNHNLRPEAGNEAAWLHDYLASQGIPCIVGQWQHKPGANLQKQARDARYQFFAEMAEKHSFNGVFIAHTVDDQLETFWLRLAHGSGLKGLGMPLKPISTRAGLSIFRPLLSLEREGLRQWLREQGHTWLEDPSNDNDKFYRIRIRKMLPELEAWGMGKNAVLALMESCLQAEKTLHKNMLELLPKTVVKEGKFTYLNKSLFTLPEVLQKRMIIHICKHYGGEDYPPRTHKITRLVQGLAQGQVMPLGKLIFRPQNERISIEKTSR